MLDTLVKDFNGNPITRLNDSLAEKQGLDQEAIDALRASHLLKHYLFKVAQKEVDANNFSDLNSMDALRQELEFFQQYLWGFPMDANFHAWYDMPGCRCPKMDNAERRGTPYNVTVRDCPIHGE